MTDDPLKPAQKKHPMPLVKDGVLLAVIRPASPKKAIESARRIQREEQRGTMTPEEAQRQFDLITTQQPYAFVGIASVDGKTLLHEDFTPIEGEQLALGDSFVVYGDVKKSMGVGDVES